MADSSQKLYPVVLSGGVGLRLWPISTATKPKQFHAFMGKETLLDLTLNRFVGHDDYRAPLIVASQHHRDLLPDNIEAILEPSGRNTAAAIAVACMSMIKNGFDGIAVFVPADHYITRVKAFHKAIAAAAKAAENGDIATIGITPTFPATGYGYIEQGEENDGIYQISKFIEKPNIENAMRFLKSENYLWNGGIFVAKPAAFLEEIKTHSPHVFESCQAAFDAADTSSLSTSSPMTFDAALYEAIPSDSIDYAVMERTTKGVVIPADIGWSDMGTWQSLWEVAEKDHFNNAFTGRVLHEDAQGCYVLSEGPDIILKSVKNIVVVATEDTVMIVDRGKSGEVRDIVGQGSAKSS
jgi:mannose-1-phosphate guanylyltransferase/mannose-6-phosphate isomerase